MLPGVDGPAAHFKQNEGQTTKTRGNPREQRWIARVVRSQKMSYGRGCPKIKQPACGECRRPRILTNTVGTWIGTARIRRTKYRRSDYFGADPLGETGLLSCGERHGMAKLRLTSDPRHQARVVRSGASVVGNWRLRAWLRAESLCLVPKPPLEITGFLAQDSWPLSQNQASGSARMNLAKALSSGC